MSSLLYVDLDLKRLYRTAAGETASLPTLRARKRWRFGLRFLRSINGNLIEEQQHIRQLRVSLGYLDRVPTSGQWKLKITAAAAAAGNTTGFLDWNVSPGKLSSTLNALADKPATIHVDQVQKGWLIKRTDGGTLALSVTENTLRPTSLPRILSRQVNSGWIYEIQLRQAPLAFNDSGEQVLPDQPTITTIQDGAIDSGGLWVVPEIQQLYIPPAFRGLYQLGYDYARTSIFSRADGPEQIKAALDEILEPYGGFVTVENIDTGKANITFLGANFVGGDIDPLSVHVYSAPPGDWTFDLELDKADLLEALRDAGGRLEELVLEADAEVVDNAADVDDVGVEGRRIELFRATVNVEESQLTEDLATSQNIDWLRPPSPKTYTPFSSDAIFTGSKGYGATIGDGAATEFVIDHNLDSDDLIVFIRENASGGARLKDDDYDIEFTDSDSLTITIAPAPSASQYRVIILNANAIDSFVEDLTITTGQVTGLDDFISNIGSRVQDLEAVLPSTGPGATPANTTGDGMITIIPETRELLHSFGVDAAISEDGTLSQDLTGFRPPPMLPAVHDATATTALPDPLPSASSNADEVWTAGAKTYIPGGGGIDASYVDEDGFVASDGRYLYPARRSGTTNSYYPISFERTLYALAINDKMLAVNRTLEILWGLQAQLIEATCKAQWVMTVQLATLSAEDEPATLGLNLENVTWGDPVFSQAILLTRLAQSHFFGIRIKRLAASFSLDQQIYGVWSGNNDAAPASANFAIRARLDRFDTENKTDPEGWIYYALIGSMSIDDDGNTTTQPARARIF